MHWEGEAIPKIQQNEIKQVAAENSASSIAAKLMRMKANWDGFQYGIVPLRIVGISPFSVFLSSKINPWTRDQHAAGS